MCACVCECVFVLNQGLFYWAVDGVADQDSQFWFGKVATRRRKRVGCMHLCMCVVGVGVGTGKVSA